MCGENMFYVMSAALEAEALFHRSKTWLPQTEGMCYCIAMALSFFSNFCCEFCLFRWFLELFIIRLEGGKRILILMHFLLPTLQLTREIFLPFKLSHQLLGWRSKQILLPVLAIKAGFFFLFVVCHPKSTFLLPRLYMLL